MRILYFLLIGAVLVNAVRLAEEPNQLLEPVSFVDEVTTSSPVICTQNCDRQSVDCQYSAWGEWGPCWGSSACGGPYFTNRTRTVVVQAVAYGTPCTSQSLFESRACTDAEISQLTSAADFQSRCAVPCIQGPWVDGPCSVTQASCPPRAQAPTSARIEGRIVRTRQIVQQPQYGGATCGPNEDVVTCYFNCRYDCEWGPWTNDGCELPCAPPAGSPGANRQRKTRRIQSFATNGGAPCLGDSVMWVEGNSCENLSNLPTCCPGCTEGAWGDWTGCSVTCGYGGTKRRTRIVTAPTEWFTNPAICGNSMPVCGETEQVQECCQEPCAEDCRCGDWTPWTDCITDNNGDMACGEGKKSRSRVCLAPVAGGKPCPAEYEEMTCSLPGCPRNCEVSEWSAFTECPATCGIRLTHRRVRTVVTAPENGGSPCPDLIDERACPCLPCPEDCQVSAWNAWGDCDQPCGPGTRQRTRDIIVTPKNGGLGCNYTVETAPCVVNDAGGYLDEQGQWVAANKPCDVNCKVGPWGEWSTCSKSCTSDTDSTFPGVRTRRRTVEIPPQYHGIPCPATIQEEWCATQCCPVDMELSEWHNWSPCSATCGGGWQSRIRTITVYPRCGGRVLSDTLLEYQRCNEQCCNTNNCVYHPYSGWSPCKQVDAARVEALYQAKDYSTLLTIYQNAPNIACPVAGGYSYRTRDIRIPNPCSPCRETFQQRYCYIECPVDCRMNAWGSWSPCDRECGWGSQRRTRSVDVEPQGGTPCPCSEEIKPCYAGPCCKDCVLTEYNPWEPCSATCGGGTQSRRRYVNMSTEFCPELECKKAGLIETRTCNDWPCPRPCEMGVWSGWSECSSTCGLGFQHRTREITYLGDGRCEWDFEERPCNNGACPTPCAYTEFTEWSPCPVSCLPPNHPPQLQYKQYRAHYRISGTGASCPPVESEEKDCDPSPFECDRMCIVGDWGEWSVCSSPYGWGERRRERPVLQHPTGGEICPQLYQIDRCYHEPPSNNCTWSVWGEWSDCSASCRTASFIPQRHRERFLVRAPTTTDYTGASGGIDASVTLSLEACASTGAKAQTESCTNIRFCPQDCIMTHWSPWSDCEHPGIRRRYRHVVSQPQYGGAACSPCLVEVDHCTVKQNDLPSGECEVGKCALEVEREREAKLASQPAAGFTPDV